MASHQLLKSIRLILIGYAATCAVMTASGNPPFILKGNVIIYTSAKPGEPVFKAILALQKDLAKILGGHSTVKNLSEINEPGIVVINSQRDGLVESLAGYEAHRVYKWKIKNQQQIILQGADMRGTIYSIYTFSEKILGVPPLWFYANWQPVKKSNIRIPDTMNIRFSSPYVKYRAWFPNDMDLLTPWRMLSAENDEIWLETALRLKLNTIQFVGETRNGVSGGTDYSKPYSVAPTTQLISDYGLINTTHHHAPLYSNFEDWNKYWKLTRNTTPPELSLANESKLEEFWRYNIERIKRNKIEVLWELGFRGDGDRPFWNTFKDAPKSEKERADVINRMLRKQRDMLVEITGDPKIQTTSIFYDEMSDLLAMDLIHAPADSNFIWTFVAARRDHYPNKDIRQIDPKKNLDLGYYLNMQFTSTGAHLAEAEGPWKMEANYRYVNSKSGHPLKFSVVNAGNIREFLLSLSANAKMMWNFDNYNTDDFLKQYCVQYFGRANAAQIASLYHDYFYAYWLPKKPDLAGFDRQYIFQDLRYKRAMQGICSLFEKNYTPDPLKDMGNESEAGRTFRIVPGDNGAGNQVEAIINGTTESAKKFLQVAKASDQLQQKLTGNMKTFFNDNLRAPAYFMYYLNTSLLNLCQAYQLPANDTRKNELLDISAKAVKNAEGALKSTEHGAFKEWYAGDQVFGLDTVYKLIDDLRKKTALN